MDFYIKRTLITGSASETSVDFLPKVEVKL